LCFDLTGFETNGDRFFPTTTGSFSFLQKESEYRGFRQFFQAIVLKIVDLNIIFVELSEAEEALLLFLQLFPKRKFPIHFPFHNDVCI
jgi:hypothetical protein